MECWSVEGFRCWLGPRSPHPAIDANKEKSKTTWPEACKRMSSPYHLSFRIHYDFGQGCMSLHVRTPIPKSRRARIKGDAYFRVTLSSPIGLRLQHNAK